MRPSHYPANPIYCVPMPCIFQLFHPALPLLHDEGICDQLECPSHVTVSSELYLIKYNY